MPLRQMDIALLDGSGYSKSTIEPANKCVFVNAIFLGHVGCTKSYSFVANKPNIRSIAPLFCWSGPFAIVGRIRSIIVLAIKGMRWRWRIANVSVEQNKVSPSLAYFDSPAPIPFETGAIFVVAPLQYPLPYSVYSRRMHPVTPSAAFATTTTLIVKNKCYPRNGSDLPTDTPANPKCAVLKSAMRETNDQKIVELNSNEISYSFRYFWKSAKICLSHLSSPLKSMMVRAAFGLHPACGSLYWRIPQCL